MKIRFFKRVCVMVVFAAMLVACSGNDKHTGTANDSTQSDTMAIIDSAAIKAQTEADAKAAEEAFAEEVTDYLTKVYTEQTSDGVFSPEFEELKGSAEMTSLKMGDGMDYFDYDVLTQSQDPGKLKGVEVTDIDGDKATAKVKGGGFGQNGTIKVSVVRIDGKLYIDDVAGEKAKMKKFLGR